MDLFTVFTLLGGIALLLYGMDAMGKGLERLAGGRLQNVLRRLVSNPISGFALGTAVTAVIQSSAATTVMAVGFINSGIMTLHQTTGIIMGANVGTTVTAWILSLTSLTGETFFLRLIKPSAFSPLIAAAGIVMYKFCKRDRQKNAGQILLGFAILMFGMETVSGAMAPLKENATFLKLFTLFENPILGVLAGMLLTVLVQSSSASVGILQALASTGAVTWGSAIPIVMGQNIGSCVTPLLSAIGVKAEARRAAIVHLLFNIIGVILFMTPYLIVGKIMTLAFRADIITAVGIAALHTGFNLLMTAILMPCSKLLEGLAAKIIPDDVNEKPVVQLDTLLLNTPAIALEQCRETAMRMESTARQTALDAVKLIGGYDEALAKSVGLGEDILDHYEDGLGSFLVKLSAREMLDEDRSETGILLHVINDFERIGDHSLNLMESAQELKDKNITFSEEAQKELEVLRGAIAEIVSLAMDAFETRNLASAHRVEPLEQVIDDLTRSLHAQHIERLQRGECTILLGFILNDVTSNMERIADHCSNIAAALIEAHAGDFDLHGYTGQLASSEEFIGYYEAYRRKYGL